MLHKVIEEQIAAIDPAAIDSSLMACQEHIAAGCTAENVDYYFALSEMAQHGLTLNDWSFLLTTGLPSTQTQLGVVHSYGVDKGNGNCTVRLNYDLVP